MTRTTLAYANEHRDWRVFAEIAGVLMRRAQRLYGETPPELGLEADLFALDATVIELSLALFPWARWQKAQASVKLNVLLDVRNDLPVFVSLHEGNRHEVASLDEIPVYPGCYYAIDRGYLDFRRLYRLHVAAAFFGQRELYSNTCVPALAAAQENFAEMQYKCNISESFRRQASDSGTRFRLTSDSRARPWARRR